MNLPSTIYVALGAATAAVIGGWVSTTTIIIAKDQKISEFRQEWLGHLRDCVAELIRDYVTLASNITLHKNNKTYDATSLNNKIVESAMEHCPSILFQISKIKMLLNPNEDTAALSVLAELEDKLTAFNKNFHAHDDVNELTTKFEVEIKIILKREWERVKKGEESYRRYKSINEFLPITIFIILLFAALIAGYVKA